MGEAALNAEGLDRQSLERLHWFTVEFGLIRDPEEIRIFGAGVNSSKDEVLHALEKAEQRPFSVEAIIDQDYEVWHLQPILFVAESFDQLVTEFRAWAVFAWAVERVTEPRAGENSHDTSPARLEAVVSGRVQGVGFRRYVRNWARKLDLTGWVRNEPNGTVRLMAEGELFQLVRLVRLLWGGPPPARVEDVATSWQDAEGVFEAFEVSR